MNSNDSEIDIGPEDIKIIVSKAFDGDIEITDYNVRPYCNYKVGFLGTHKSLEIMIKRKNSNKSEKHNFFAKIVPQDSTRYYSFVRQNKFFNQEAEFYNVVMPHLLKFYKGEPWGPKCYLANEDVVVLEDVRNKGYVMRENKIFEDKYLKSAAKALARMHACSVLAENRFGKPLKEIFPNACVEQIFNKNSKDRGLFKVLVDLAEKIARDHGHYHQGVSSALEEVYNRIQSSKGKNQVISHADSWANNFMFNLDEPPKCLIIDFQMTRYANRMWDVAQLIYFSTTQEIRKKEETNVVYVYHEEFSKVIERHDSTLVLPSFSDTLEEYEEARLPALFSAMFYYPFVLVRKEEYLKHKDDPEAIYNKYIHRLDNNSVLNLMKRDKEYGRRITETALELVEYCGKMLSEKVNGL